MESTASKRDNSRPSCAVCHRRKVKCSREFPCDSCTKSGLECTYTSSKRKRRRTSKESSSPLRKSSTQNAAELSSIPSTTETLYPSAKLLPQSSPPTEAHLVSDGQGYRYVNNYIWNALPKQNSYNTYDADRSPSPVRGQPEKAEEQYRGNSHPGYTLEKAKGHIFHRHFIFESGYVHESHLQIQPHHIVTLWQKYLKNVDPVMKIIHVPTVQQLVLGQVGKSPLSAYDHSLVCSIFFVSVVSLTDSECNDLLQISRDQMIEDLRYETERALSSANFVTTTEMVVLQALVIYLAALRSLGEIHTVWSILGIAARVASTLGLARDGSTLNLPPFECEMRRRLWWTLVYLDARTAELVGQDVDLLVQKFDVQAPANLSDSELFPLMKNTPQLRPGATEAIYIVQRATYGSILHSSPTLAALTRGGSISEHSPNPFEEIRKLQARINNDFIRHCDPTIPLQLFTSIAGKMLIIKLLLAAKSPSGTAEDNSSEVFALSLELIELQLSLWSEPSLQQWRWYCTGFFPWHAFISLIRQARLCEDKAMATQAWTIIRRVLDIMIPTIDIEPRKSLLLEAIKTLLSSATAPQTSRFGGEQEKTAVSDVVSERTDRPMVASAFAAPWIQPHGSRPHSALLPGMSTSIVPPADAAHATISGDDNYLALEFDLDVIDWSEFDRLVSGLETGTV